jgi:hypothetical protein
MLVIGENDLTKHSVEGVVHHTLPLISIEGMQRGFWPPAIIVVCFEMLFQFLEDWVIIHVDTLKRFQVVSSFDILYAALH